MQDKENSCAMPHLSIPKNYLFKKELQFHRQNSTSRLSKKVDGDDSSGRFKSIQNYKVCIKHPNFTSRLSKSFDDSLESYNLLYASIERKGLPLKLSHLWSWWCFPKKFYSPLKLALEYQLCWLLKILQCYFSQSNMYTVNTYLWSLCFPAPTPKYGLR